MQKNLQVVSLLASSDKNTDTPRVKSAPVELDAAQLKQVGGGLGPNGTWSAATTTAAGPNGTW